MELNPDSDLIINIDELTSEFRNFPSVFYRYCLYKAKVEAQRDLAKAKLKEAKAIAYKRIKSDTTIKHTEKSMEAEIDTDPEVMDAQIKMIRAEHDASTWSGAVESMKSKRIVLYS